MIDELALPDFGDDPEIAAFRHQAHQDETARQRRRFAEALAGARHRGADDTAISAALSRALDARRDVADEVVKVGRH